MKTKWAANVEFVFVTVLFFMSYYGAYELGKLIGETQESLTNKRHDIINNQKLQNCLTILKEYKN